jgi:hypothetical protein
MSELVDKCLDYINASTINQLNFEWDGDVYIVSFTENGGKYSFRFYRRLFGIFSEISIVENDINTIKESRLKKHDYKVLKYKFKERIDFLNQSKFDTIFKSFNRDNNLKKLIN